VALRPLFYSVLHPLARLYWRLRKPRTYGIKVLLLPADGGDEVLLVQHAYGNRRLWNLPGGGYAPGRETPEQAARREIREELGMALGDLDELGVYQTGAEGKLDTVRIFAARIPRDAATSLDSAELAGAAWFSLPEVFRRDDVARVVRTGVRQLRGENRFETYAA
jgi:8-oxo-dGTP pyrophosphatase MutT (NUDIX family)